MNEIAPRIFISYARADDEPFVERLYRDLTVAGISVWWDREKMESRGRTFLQEIRDAIEKDCDRLIAVIGPHAVISEYVRYEWEHGLLSAKGTVPILRLGDYDLVPSELLPENDQGLASSEFAKLHCPDFREGRPYKAALKELVRIIRQPLPRLGALNGTPNLPPYFLPRRDGIKKLQQAVLADVHRPTLITSARQTSALQGMAGIGKSVLAAAFARTISTRRAFEDGVVWLTAGQKADKSTLLTNIAKLGSAFEDDPVHYASEVSALTRLPTLLARTSATDSGKF